MERHPNAPDLMDILRSVASGASTPEAAAEALRSSTEADLGFARVDLHRQARRGRPETIFCQGKTWDQVGRIASAMLEAGQNVLLTRMDAACMERCREEFGARDLVVCDPARAAFIRTREVPRKSGVVAVFSAGTTDIPVAEEAALTAESFGSPVERVYDVGVAGVHRLLKRRETLDRARVVVVVAGMEGALASVVGGLARAPVIAVPTSVGYGASFGGLAALLAMLNSCAPGVSVVNIDNGFGAGYLADVINEVGEGGS